MAGQHVLLLPGVVLLLAVHLSAGSDCSEETLQEMQTDFNDCAAGLGNQFEDTRDTFQGVEYIQESACILFSKIVKKCGKVWKKCHAEDEIQDLKDMHLESLMSQYKEIKLNHCPIVKKYIKSRRRKEGGQEMQKCDDGASVAAQKTFQACSQSTSTSAYQNIMDVKEKHEVWTILCDALKNISKVCTKDLEECFSDEDLAMMTSSHLKEMQNFLARITRGKVKMEELDACEIYKAKDEVATDNDSSQVEYEKEEEKEMFTEKNDHTDVFEVKNTNININDDGNQENNYEVTNKTYLVKPEIDSLQADLEENTKDPNIDVEQEKPKSHKNKTNLARPEPLMRAADNTDNKSSSIASCLFKTFLFPFSLAYIFNKHY